MRRQASEGGVSAGGAGRAGSSGHRGDGDRRLAAAVVHGGARGDGGVAAARAKRAPQNVVEGQRSVGVAPVGRAGGSGDSLPAMQGGGSAASTGRSSSAAGEKFQMIPLGVSRAGVAVVTA